MTPPPTQPYYISAIALWAGGGAITLGGLGALGGRRKGGVASLVIGVIIIGVGLLLWFLGPSAAAAPAPGPSAATAELQATKPYRLHKLHWGPVVARDFDADDAPIQVSAQPDTPQFGEPRETPRRRSLRPIAPVAPVDPVVAVHPIEPDQPQPALAVTTVQPGPDFNAYITSSIPASAWPSVNELAAQRTVATAAVPLGPEEAILSRRRQLAEAASFLKRPDWRTSLIVK